MRLPIQVAVYPVRYSHGKLEYLLLHRVPLPRKNLDAFWQGVTGGVELGEDILFTAQRELQEETGFHQIELNVIDYTYSYPIYEEWKKSFDKTMVEENITEHVFTVIIENGQDPILSKEHDDWKWCKLEEAVDLLHFQGNIDSIRKCDEFLKQREK